MLNKKAKPHEIVLIGDRILTDVLMANMNNFKSILTKEIIDERWDNFVAKHVC